MPYGEFFAVLTCAFATMVGCRGQSAVAPAPAAPAAAAATPTAAAPADDPEVGDPSSPYWTRKDSDKVGDFLAKDLLAQSWVSEHATREGKKPTVKLEGVIKRTDDRNVDAGALSDRIQMNLVRSGSLKVLAGAAAIDEAAAASVPPADAVLSVTITSDYNSDDERWTRTYAVVGKLADASGQLLWSGQGNIRKTGPVEKPTEEAAQP